MSTSAATDWTCSGHSSQSAIKILDRVAVSAEITCSDIRTLDRVALTNHRPILVKAKTGLYTRFSATRSRHAPAQRLRRPNKGKAEKQYAAMNDCLEEAMNRRPPPTLSLEDLPEQADTLLSYCDAIFTAACNTAFKRPRADNGLSLLQVQSALTDALGRRLQAVSRLKNAIQSGTLSNLLGTSPAVREEFGLVTADSATQLSPTDMLSKLSALRSSLRKRLNAERRKVLSKVADVKGVSDIKTVLRTGRVKSLFPCRIATHPGYVPNH